MQLPSALISSYVAWLKFLSAWTSKPFIRGIAWPLSSTRWPELACSADGKVSAPPSFPAPPPLLLEPALLPELELLAELPLVATLPLLEALDPWPPLLEELLALERVLPLPLEDAELTEEDTLALPLAATVLEALPLLEPTGEEMICGLQPARRARASSTCSTASTRSAA